MLKKLRTYFTLLYVAIDTMILASISIFCSLFDSTGETQYWFAKTWGRSNLWGGGITYSVSGLSNIKGEGPFIFAPNHQSYLDIFILLAMIPRSFRFLAKESLFKWPFMGWHMSRAGYIPINRSETRDAVRSLLNIAKKIKSGTSVLIFPEGERTPPNTLGEFKKGAFYIAAKTGVPIVPIILKNTANLYPRDSLLIQPGKVEVTVLPMIETKDFGPKKVKELMEHARKIMEKHFP